MGFPCAVRRNAAASEGVSQVAVAVVRRIDRASNQSALKATTVETEDTVPTLTRRTP